MRARPGPRPGLGKGAQVGTGESPPKPAWGGSFDLYFLRAERPVPRVCPSPRQMPKARPRQVRVWSPGGNANPAWKRPLHLASPPPQTPQRPPPSPPRLLRAVTLASISLAPETPRRGWVLEEQKVTRNPSVWDLQKTFIARGEILQKTLSLLAFPHPALLLAPYLHLYNIQYFSQAAPEAQRNLRASRRQSTAGCWGVCRLRALGWAWPIRLR